VTFFAPTVAGYIMVLAISSEIRALICGAFLARTIVLFNYRSFAVKAHIAFSLVVTIYLVIETILAFFPRPIGAGCLEDPSEFGWHDKSIMWLDTIEAALMIILALILFF